MNDRATGADPPDQLQPRRPDDVSVALLVGSVLGGVGGLYVATHSVPITVVGAAVMVVVVAMVLFKR